MDIYYFANFGSRSDTMRFSGILNRSGISCRIINTPPGAGDICSVSVMFCACELDRVIALLKANPYLNFRGMFRCLTDGWKNEIKRII